MTTTFPAPVAAPRTTERAPAVQPDDDTPPFRVWGIAYETLPELTARMALLTFENIIYGPSDGRVAEARAIVRALIEYCGSESAVTQLMHNAAYLGAGGAPVLSLATERDIVHHAYTLRNAPLVPFHKRRTH